MKPVAGNVARCGRHVDHPVIKIRPAFCYNRLPFFL